MQISQYLFVTAHGSQTNGAPIITGDGVDPASWWAFVDLLPDPVVVLDNAYALIHGNPAFKKSFGWNPVGLDRRKFLSVLDKDAEKVRQRLYQLRRDHVIRGICTQWSTRAGRKLKVTLDAVQLFDNRREPKGVVLTVQGLLYTPRAERSRQILLRMSGALHRYGKLDRLLSYVTRLIRGMLQVGGVSVIFLDAEKEAFYFQMASYEDAEVGRRIATIRFPADKGAAGEVYRTGRPLIVSDYAKSPFALKEVDEQTQYVTRNLLDVPLRIKDRMIGVLRTVNKRDGAFDDEDIELLSAIADVVALPIENARVNEALQASRERIKILNKTKERAIVHLSHELKTPLSVLSASLQLLEKKRSSGQDHTWADAYGRAQRNLQRLLEMAYAVEDILRRSDSAPFDTMTRLPRADVQESEPEKSESFFQQVNIEFLVHELKDPLSIIETNANMLGNFDHGNKGAANRQRRLLKRILRSAARARSLLEELLEVGRAEAVYFNCLPFEPVQVVRQVLMEIIESHASDLYEKMRSAGDISAQMKLLSTGGVRMEAQPAAESIRMVQDVTKFRQIVGNLLKNALTCRRKLMLINLTYHKGILTLSVRDDGPGVADAHREKIFERYTQVSPFPGVARGGHGLGLAVARLLARSMDGDITLESQLGQGARFQLTLPVKFDGET